MKIQKRYFSLLIYEVNFGVLRGKNSKVYKGLEAFQLVDRQTKG